MSSRTPRTFPLFELTIVGALALIGWVAFRLYEIGPEMGENRKQLVNLRTEYFSIAQFVHVTVNELTDALTNYLQTKDPAELRRYEDKNRELDQWLQKKERSLAQISLPPAPEYPTTTVEETTNETALAEGQFLIQFSRIESAVTNFQKAAGYLITNSGQPLINQRRAVREMDLQRARSRLLVLARQSRLRGEAMDWFLAGPQKAYGNLEDRFQHLRFALLLASVGLCFLLMLAIYRGKLAQTRHIIQQHKHEHLEQQAHLDKLEHFSRLAQELAHEIKQPLTAINARVYTLQKLLPAGSEPQKDALVIRSEIKRLDRIVKDFLELARPTEPKLAPLTAQDTLREICDLMESQLAQESIELKFDCEDHLEFLGDANQLKQVLINLVRNAAESLEGTGTITLRAHRGNGEADDEPNGTAIIEVADTGRGIPPEIQSRIFDPFFSTKGEGTGLGLAIAARIVDKHGGKLEFDTEPGKGTVFRMILPAAGTNQPHEQSPAHRR